MPLLFQPEFEYCVSYSLLFLTRVIVVGHVQPGNEYWIRSLQHVLELARSLCNMC